MNLAQHIENIFASSTDAELEALLQKANFDHYNAVGVDILSPEQALQRAEEMRNTFSADSIPEYRPEHAERAWCFTSGHLDLAGETLFFFGDGLRMESLYRAAAVPMAECAGKTEDAPLAA